jgi:hypothetical protein
MIPPAGRYTLAGDGVSALSTPLFCIARDVNGFLASAPLPEYWEPGTRLSLRGPLGKGFALPDAAKRVALISGAEDASILLALAGRALANGADVTLFGAIGEPGVHPSIEVSPLDAFAQARDWAEYCAFDVRIEDIPKLRARLGLDIMESIRVPAQIFVRAAMPCAALAECGVCALKARRGWLLACQDGPVLDLEALDW